MKIVWDKDEKEILNRLIACQIIANHYLKDIEAYDKMTQNLASIMCVFCNESKMEQIHDFINEKYVF